MAVRASISIRIPYITSILAPSCDGQFVDGRLYKSEKGQLASMIRNRLEDEVQLVRSDLSDIEAREFLATMRSHLARLGNSLAEGKFTVEGQVPDDVDVVARAQRWLEDLPSEIAIAQTPRSL